MKLKEQIEQCLEKYPETRDCDLKLTMRIWHEFYPELLFTYNDRPCVTLKNILELPREDNVKRYRAKIQNEEHRFLPSLEVALTRGIAEDKWRFHMGYPPKYPIGQQKLV